MSKGVKNKKQEARSKKQEARSKQQKGKKGRIKRNERRRRTALTVGFL